MPRPTETIRLAADRSTVCADSRKRSPGWLRICEASSAGHEFFDRAGAGVQRVGTEGARLHGGEAGARAGMDVIRVQFSLQQLAHEDGPAGSRLIAITSAIRRLPEAGGQARREVANLIGVGEEHQQWVERW